ncbi:TonB-dependent receptor [Arachidicoccus soli]|uniref:TonB-dependent receptor n=2 Tax=Arachidicoccus soli TaxID=2341117 RepID=A0A386HMB6_9BACT|nr:TonB-dependent receptor [Arachidicoccus soli]
MRQFLSICLMIFSISVASAQSNVSSGSLTGVIVDTISHNVDKASISLVNARDTSIVKNTLSDSVGNFKFSNLPFDTYILRISFQGYEILNKYVAVTKTKPVVELGDITLQQSINELGTVTVTAVIPITLNGDTTSYSADAFGTKPNATVEDLLKKLPGVQVDQNGVVTAQGETVSRVFVDGKRFFGSDPKLATQNLPKDVVDKIQVFDGKSDQSEFSGFDDGTTIKTINIVTKPAMRHGWFGKTSAGIGNENTSLKDPLYSVTPRVMRFNGNMKLGLFGQLNNINVQNFTRSDQNNRNGLTKTAAANLFFGDTWGKKVTTDFSGRYGFNSTNVNLLQNTIRQNFYSNPALDNNNLSNDSSKTLTQNQSVDLNFLTKFDSSNQLRVRPTLSFNKSNSNNQSTTEIDSLSNGTSIPKTLTNSISSNNNISRNAGFGATYMHAFAKKGRTITLDLQYSNSYSNSNGNYFSHVNYLDLNSDSTINQKNVNSSNNNSLSTSLTYTEPIGVHQQLELSYNNSFSNNTADRRTYDFDSLTNGYTNLNNTLTNYFVNKYLSNRGTLGYMYNDGTVNFNVSGGVQFGRMESNNLSKNYGTITNNYVNLYPTASFTYNISKTKKLLFRYQGRTNQPSVSQLQPITDSSNLLNITSGNPNLKQEFNNHFQFRYNNVDRTGSGKSFFAFVDASFVHNNIQNAVIHLSNGGQSSMPVNLNGNYTLRGYLDFGLPLTSPKSNFDFSTNISNSRISSLIDSEKNFTYTTSFAEGIRWSTSVSKSFDINASVTPSYNISKYSITSSINSSNTNYYSQSSSFEGTFYTNSGWQLASDFNYTFYRGKAPGQNISIPLWNASITKQIFKNKAGEISLSVHDILNENKGVNFQRSLNYSSQTTTNILKRYALLTFTYNLKQFGKKGDRNGNRSWDRGGQHGGFGGGHGGFGGGHGGGRGGF